MQSAQAMAPIAAMSRPEEAMEDIHPVSNTTRKSFDVVSFLCQKSLLSPVCREIPNVRLPLVGQSSAMKSQTCAVFFAVTLASSLARVHYPVTCFIMQPPQTRTTMRQEVAVNNLISA